MVHEAVCLERKLLVLGAKIEDVVSICQKTLKEMGLKVTNLEKNAEGSTIVMAGEGALVPLTLKTLLYPFNLQQFIKSAQRSGVHVVISPSEEGAILYSCGLALDERTGKPAEYADEDIEEITDTMEALDFEKKFTEKIKRAFPQVKEIE